MNEKRKRKEDNNNNNKIERKKRRVQPHTPPLTDTDRQRTTHPSCNGGHVFGSIVKYISIYTYIQRLYAYHIIEPKKRVRKNSISLFFLP